MTPNRRSVLAALIGSTRERGYPPTVRELCELTGFTSTSTIHAQLRNLELMGLVEHDAMPGRPRTWVPRAGLLEFNRQPWEIVREFDVDTAPEEERVEALA